MLDLVEGSCSPVSELVTHGDFSGFHITSAAATWLFFFPQNALCQVIDLNVQATPLPNSPFRSNKDK